MFFDWIINSIKDYFNTPDDKMTNDITSSFWAAITVIAVTILGIVIIILFIKAQIDDYKLKHRDVEKEKMIEEMDQIIEKLKKE